MTYDEACSVKVGDYVMVNADEYSINGEPVIESKLQVVEPMAIELETPGYLINHTKVEQSLIKDFPEDFTKVEDGYFSGGIVSGEPTGLFGEQCPETIIPMIRSNQLEGGWQLNKSGDFEVTVDVTNDGKPYVSGMGLGVYRPNLEDRKVGKVQMHMVDDGFPNALREVAKVMTWAADAKGYKLHDWKNLPNAGEAFPSAGYRHRNDSSIQKAQGVRPVDRTDHESSLLHKAHEAFNILAELELILTGVIK